MSAGRRLQFAAVTLFVVVYSVLSHYSNSHAQAHDLATLLALAPMLTLGLVLTWRWRGPWAASLLAAAAAALLIYDWSVFTANFSLVYLMQQCGFYSLMALTFGRSLSAGAEPLCTTFADKVHGPLTALELRYTRQVTLAWTLFFLANLLLTFLLFAFASLQVWSLFVNFGSMPLIGLMFIGEYAVRRRVLPQLPRNGLLATLRVYFTCDGYFSAVDAWQPDGRCGLSPGCRGHGRTVLAACRTTGTAAAPGQARAQRVRGLAIVSPWPWRPV